MKIKLVSFPQDYNSAAQCACVCGVTYAYVLSVNILMLILMLEGWTNLTHRLQLVGGGEGGEFVNLWSRFYFLLTALNASAVPKQPITLPRGTSIKTSPTTTPGKRFLNFQICDSLYLTKLGEGLHFVRWCHRAWSRTNVNSLNVNL